MGSRCGLGAANMTKSTEQDWKLTGRLKREVKKIVSTPPMAGGTEQDCPRPACDPRACTLGCALRYCFIIVLAHVEPSPHTCTYAHHTIGTPRHWCPRPSRFDSPPNKTQLFPQSSTLQKFNPDPQRAIIHGVENAMSIREARSEHASIDLAFWILYSR